MFCKHDLEQYYNDATKDARVNLIEQDQHKIFNRRNFFIFNLLLLLSTLGYFSYTYLDNTLHFFKKTSVLGVSYTSDEENQKLEALLNTMEADTIEEETFNQEALNQIVQESDAQSEYIASLTKEISPQKSDEVTIIAQRGDTLRTIAMQYYGDPEAYKKILQDNPHIDPHSKKIYEGQSIILHY